MPRILPDNALRSKRFGAGGTPPAAESARKGGGVADPATLAEGVYFFCWVGPKFEAVTDVTSEGLGR